MISYLYVLSNFHHFEFCAMYNLIRKGLLKNYYESRAKTNWFPKLEFCIVNFVACLVSSLDLIFNFNINSHVNFWVVNFSFIFTSPWVMFLFPLIFFSKNLIRKNQKKNQKYWPLLSPLIPLVRRMWSFGTAGVIKT